MSTPIPRPSVAPNPTWSFPASTGSRLDNGLEVKATRLPNRGMAAVELLVDAGTDLDPAGLEGVAVLAARLLQEGSGGRDAATVARNLEACGASMRIRSTTSGMRISLDAPKSRLGDALAVLTTTIFEPDLPVAGFERLVAERLAEIKRERAAAGTLAMITWSALAHDPGVRAARPDGGTAETVAAISYDDVTNFYRDHVAPNSSSIAIVGDAAPEELTATVAAAFAEWQPNAQTRSPANIPLAAAAGPTMFVVDRPGSVQTQLFMGRPSISVADPRWPALTVAFRVLGSGLNSRLNLVLREDKGYTYGIGATAVPRRGGSWAVTASGSVHTAVTGAAITELLSIVGSFQERLVTADELSLAVEAMTGPTPMRYELTTAVAGELIDGVALDRPDGHVDAYEAAVRATTAAEATAAYLALVESQPLTMIAVGDTEQVAPQLADAGISYEPVPS